MTGRLTAGTGAWACKGGGGRAADAWGLPLGSWPEAGELVTGLWACGEGRGTAGLGLGVSRRLGCCTGGLLSDIEVGGGEPLALGEATACMGVWAAARDGLMTIGETAAVPNGGLASCSVLCAGDGLGAGLCTDRGLCSDGPYRFPDCDTTCDEMLGAFAGMPEAGVGEMADGPGGGAVREGKSVCEGPGEGLSKPEGGDGLAVLGSLDAMTGGREDCGLTSPIGGV